MLHKEHVLKLFLQTELLNEIFVALFVLARKVLQVLASVSYHLEQTST